MTFENSEALEQSLQILKVQSALDGTGELQPAQVSTPDELVMPQALGAEVQDKPRPAGFGGATALQTPEQLIAPLAVAPQAFATEVQVLPYPAGFGGATALQTPAQL